MGKTQLKQPRCLLVALAIFFLACLPLRGQNAAYGKYYVRLENHTKERVFYHTLWSTATGSRTTGWRKWQIEPSSVAICSGPLGYSTMVIKFHTGGQYGKVIETVIQATQEGPQESSTRLLDWNERNYLRLYTVHEHKYK